MLPFVLPDSIGQFSVCILSDLSVVFVSDDNFLLLDILSSCYF